MWDLCPSARAQVTPLRFSLLRGPPPRRRYRVASDTIVGVLFGEFREVGWFLVAHLFGIEFRVSGVLFF